jgi:putative DNA primase/helicase
LLHRFHVDGDRSGTRNGWYVLHTDGRAAGIFGSWKTGFRSTWAADGKRLNDAEHEVFAELIRAARTKANAERRAEHEARAIEARAIWARAGAADPAHPYLLAKGVQAHSLRQDGAALVVPLFDIHGLLWNVQRIMPDGGKRFRPGRAGGLYSPIGQLMNPATAADLRRLGDRRNAARRITAPGTVRHERRQPIAGSEGGARCMAVR